MRKVLAATLLLAVLAPVLAFWSDLRVFHGEAGVLIWAGTVRRGPGGGLELALVVPRCAEPPSAPGTVRMRAVLAFRPEGRDLSGLEGCRVGVVGVCGRLEPGRPRPLRVLLAAPLPPAREG